jgi:hypothetical protein
VKIEVKNYGGKVTRRLELPERGLILISAPNGLGKSAMLADAPLLAMFGHTGSRGDALRGGGEGREERRSMPIVTKTEDTDIERLDVEHFFDLMGVVHGRIIGVELGIRSNEPGGTSGQVTQETINDHFLVALLIIHRHTPLINQEDDHGRPVDVRKRRQTLIDRAGRRATGKGERAATPGSNCLADLIGNQAGGRIDELLLTHSGD